MKIISKHKDYYDWAVSIYGLDEIMVYDRRTEYLEKPEKDPTTRPLNGHKVASHKFSICNRIYVVYQYRNKFYHTVDDLLVLNEILKVEKVDDTFLRTKYSWRNENKKLRTVAEEKYKKENHKSKVNKEIREPVLIQAAYSKGSFPFTAQRKGATFFDSNKKISSYWRIPDLSAYGFASWFSSEQMFQDVYAFISWKKDHPEIPNKQSDTEKLKSHGFDDKISFRHRK